ncbi:MAG TPA: hypothetical protein VMU50_11280 [Polyangia bacterium]|nr:hypothetical protein [Polyangia bacterium]
MTDALRKWLVVVGLERNICAHELLGRIFKQEIRGSGIAEATDSSNV